MGNMSGSYGSHYTIWINIKINSQDVSGNSSNVTAELYLSFDGSSYYSYTNNTTRGNMVLIWDGQEKVNESYSISQISFTSGQKKDILLASWTGNIPHDSKGERLITVSGSWDTQTSRIGSGVATVADFGLTYIKRAPSFTTKPYLTSRGLESLTFSYGAVDMASSIYYSLDNKTWNPIYAQTTTITGLKPNTNYTIYVQARNQQNHSFYNTTSFNATTLDIARITSAPNNIQIGQNPTINFTNPSGSKITLWAVGKYNNTSIVISDYINVTGKSSYTLNLNTDTIYKNFTTTNNITIVYALTTVKDEYLSSSTKSGTIVNSNPIFTDFNYSESDSKLAALTGGTPNIIKGYSDIYVTVPASKKAQGKNYASILNYKAVIGSSDSSTFNYSSTENVSSKVFNNITTNVIDVYATDSRGNSTKVSKTANIKNYFNIKIASLNSNRENGIGEKVIIDFRIEFWNGNFGAVQNSIKSLTYKYKKTDSSTYINGTTTLSYTVSGNIVTGSVKLDETFELNETYDIQLIVNDELTNDNENNTISSGNPAIAIYKNKVAIGQAYDTSKGGALQINGDAFINGSMIPIPFVMWTNPNPNVAFEKQVINLNTDDYDMYEIFYRISLTSYDVLSVKGIAGQGVWLCVSYGYENKAASRGIHRVQGNKKSFYGEVAYWGSSAIRNDICIPLYIVGYKTGLNLNLNLTIT